MEGVKQIMGVSIDDLCGRSRVKHIVDARSLFVNLALLYSRSKRREIAEFLCRVPRIIPYLE